jgi:hypothetical protein
MSESPCRSRFTSGQLLFELRHEREEPEVQVGAVNLNMSAP